MEMQQLVCFVAVAEERNFTRAAVRCFVTQQSLSASIKALEARLGERLFSRSPRHVTLTEAGERLLPHAQQILNHAEDGLRAVRAISTTLEGRLRLGVNIDAAPAALPVIAALLRCQPDLDVEILGGNDPGLQEKLRDDELDAAITWWPEPEMRGRARLLSKQELVVATAVGGDLAHEDVIGARHLSSSRVTLFNREKGIESFDALASMLRGPAGDPRFLQADFLAPFEGAQSAMLRAAQRSETPTLVTRVNFDYYRETQMVARASELPPAEIWVCHNERWAAFADALALNWRSTGEMEVAVAAVGAGAGDERS